jgi:hypothetical protein
MWHRATRAGRQRGSPRQRFCKIKRRQVSMKGEDVWRKGLE